MPLAPDPARPTLAQLRSLGLARHRYALYDPLQRVVVGLNRLPPLLAFNRALYRLALHVGLRYVTVPGVESVYLRGSMAGGGLTPGMSDIDLQFVIVNLSPQEEYEFQRRFWERFRRLRRLLPIFGDAFSGVAKEYRLGGLGGHLFVASGATEELVVGPGVGFETLVVPESVLATTALKRLLRNYCKGVCFQFAGLVETSLRGFYRLRPGFVRDAEWLLGRRTDAGRRLNDESRRLAAQGHRTGEAGRVAERVFLASFQMLQQISEAPLRGLPAGADAGPKPSLWPEDAPPVHRDRALRWTEALHKRLRKLSPGVQVQIVLGASPHRDHDFRLYAFIPSNADAEEVSVTAAAVRSAYWRSLEDGPWDLFTTFRAPLILPASAARLLPMGYRGPGEHAYLRRHGVCLNGSVEDLALECRSDWEQLSLHSEAVMNCTYMRKRFWEIPKDSQKVRTVLHDLLAGVVPATRLALDDDLAVTTVAEAQAAFRQTHNADEVDRLDAVARACLANQQHQPRNEWMFGFLRTQIDAIYASLAKRLAE